MSLGQSLVSFVMLALSVNSWTASASKASSQITPQIAMDELAKTYVAIQEALARDHLEDAQSHTQALQKQVVDSKTKEQKAIQSALKAMNESTSLASLRKGFKKLSSVFVAWVESTKAQGYVVVYCPMAGAKWVQKEGEVRNPYFGAEMLQCGEKTS